mgnify:CR=1 FL=1
MKIPKPIRSPFFGFLLMGSLLFFFESLTDSDRKPIVVSMAQQQRLATLWKTQTGSIATPEQIESLIRNWIDEEVLYQEALRLGLDHEDSIVRRRMIQKLGFIAESDPPGTEAEVSIDEYYQQNLNNYTLPERYTFEQLYFERKANADEALAVIALGESSRNFGEFSMLNSQYAFRSRQEIDTTFGSGFADKFDRNKLNSWQGPYTSGLGFHLVQIKKIHRAEVTPLDAIRDRVRMDFQRDKEVSARKEFLRNLSEHYSVTIESK